MRIERISDNQIRCTLTKNDLMERHLKISELAYGSEKAKELFRDMMEQASVDFGFEADDIPIMIEAIPTNRDSIVLIITKVEDPEEFEEKFSNFTPGSADYENDLMSGEDLPDDPSQIPEDLINCFDQIGDLVEGSDNDSEDDSTFIPLRDTLQPAKKKKKASKRKNRVTTPIDTSRAYSFESLEEIIDVAHIVGDHYQGKNTVWKDESNNRYYLYLTKAGRLSDFKRTCDTISEYGDSEKVSFATTEYYDEHFKVIIRDKALLTLSVM